MALERIVAEKRAAVAARMRAVPLAAVRAGVGRAERDFEAALRAGPTAFVLECKRASPSAGELRPGFDPAAIARAYAPFASAVSVLTDEPFFGGSLAHLGAVRAASPLPVLCKDFVVDPYQVYEARRAGADSILLMCSVLDDAGLGACLAAARELGMEPLIEVHDEAELARALASGARIVGINNRDLGTLAVDLGTTERLAPLVPPGVVRVCESGIEGHRGVVRLRRHVDAFLVGTALMRAERLDEAVRSLVFGRVKICGLTRPRDAVLAHASGASYGGLVLWPGSPRAVTLERARAVRDAAPLRWAGVFVDAPEDEVSRAAEALALDVVQLHGEESAAFAERLRERFRGRAEIWKAARVRDELPPPARAADAGADRLLLDAYHAGVPGGTGERFDWRHARTHEEREALVLGGGLTAACAAEADAIGCFALDVSSGVERAPGEKDAARVGAFFAALRGRGRDAAGAGP
jgi:indole-3-glycerol phosphate synthase/phosphoribosylanthranilate isomerase